MWRNVNRENNFVCERCFSVVHIYKTFVKKTETEAKRVYQESLFNRGDRILASFRFLLVWLGDGLLLTVGPILLKRGKNANGKLSPGGEGEVLATTTSPVQGSMLCSKVGVSNSSQLEEG